MRYRSAPAIPLQLTTIDLLEDPCEALTSADGAETATTVSVFIRATTLK